MIQDYEQGVLRKEPVTGPFIERFKQLHWESLTDNVHKYLDQFA